MRNNTNETFEMFSETRAKEASKEIREVKKGTRPQVTILKSERKNAREDSSKIRENQNITIRNKLTARFHNVTMQTHGSKTDRVERHAVTMTPHSKDDPLLGRRNANNLQSRFFSLRR